MSTTTKAALDRAEQFANDTQKQLAWSLINGCISELTYNEEAQRVRFAVEFYKSNKNKNLVITCNSQPPKITR